MIHPPDPVDAAWAALRRSATAAGCRIVLVEGHAAPWWSATFTGDAVWLTIGIDPGAAADRWVVALPDADLSNVELSTAGRLVADCLVERDSPGTAAVSLLILAVD